MSIYVLPSTSFFLYLVSLSFFNSHPSNRVLFLFHPYELEIESYSRRACPRVSGRSRSGVSCFVSNFFQFVRLFARVGRVGGGVRSCVLPKECRTFFPKTTVSWLHKQSSVKLYSIIFLHIFLFLVKITSWTESRECAPYFFTRRIACAKDMVRL